MVKNFKYIDDPTLPVGNETYINANDKISFNNFALVKSRDELDLMIVRTNVKGSVVFRNSDFDNILPFAKVREPLKCNFDIICDNCSTVNYKGFLIFDERIDFNNCTLSATIKIIDEYSPFLEGIQYYENNKMVKSYWSFYSNVYEMMGNIFENNRKLYTQNIDNEAFCTWNINLKTLIEKYLILYTGSPDVFLVVKDYYVSRLIRRIYITMRQNFSNYANQFDDINDDFSWDLKRPDFNLKEILDILRDKYFIYWKITNTNNIYFYYYDKLTQTATDINSLILRSDDNVKILMPDFSKITYETFTLEDELPSESQFFATYSLTFDNSSDTQKTQKDRSFVDVYQKPKKTNEIMLLHSRNNSWIRYHNYTRQFFPISDLTTGQFLDGDWDRLDFNTTVSELIIYTHSFYMMDGESMRVTVRAYNLDNDIPLTYKYDDGGIHTNIGDIKNGSNTFTISAIEGYLRLYIHIPVSALLTRYFRNFRVRSNRARHIRKENSVTGVSIYNGKLSITTSLLSANNNVCEMPNDNYDGHIYKQKDTFTQYCTLKHTDISNLICFSEVLFYHSRQDMKYTYSIKGNDLDLYSIEQRHDANTQSKIKFEFRGTF